MDILGGVDASGLMVGAFVGIIFVIIFIVILHYSGVMIITFPEKEEEVEEFSKRFVRDGVWHTYTD